MTSPEHRDRQPLSTAETAARRPVVPGVDEFREMELLAAAALYIDSRAYRYTVAIQDCGAFKEPK